MTRHTFSELSSKRGQLYQIIVRRGFQGLPSFAPGCQAADDIKRIKPFFAE